jgi:hypothetical protein
MEVQLLTNCADSGQYVGKKPQDIAYALRSGWHHPSHESLIIRACHVTVTMTVTPTSVPQVGLGITSGFACSSGVSAAPGPGTVTVTSHGPTGTVRLGVRGTQASPAEYL